MGSEPTSYLREIRVRDNEICSGMKCVSVVIEVCSGKFKWLLLIIILPESKLTSQLPNFGHLLVNFQGYNFS